MRNMRWRSPWEVLRFEPESRMDRSSGFSAESSSGGGPLKNAFSRANLSRCWGKNLRPGDYDQCPDQSLRCGNNFADLPWNTLGSGGLRHVARVSWPYPLLVCLFCLLSIMHDK